MVRPAHHERNYEPLTLALCREGKGDGFALRVDYELDSRFARMTAEVAREDYAALRATSSG